MKHAIATAAFFLALALAACGATPIHSTQEPRPTHVIKNYCLETKLTDDACPACFSVKTELTTLGKGEMELAVDARGPESWGGPIDVELFDADGPFCSVSFSANGIQPCGIFLIENADTFGVSIKTGEDSPHGVSLSLLSVSR